MKILKISGIVILALIAIVLVLGLVSPNDFKLERTVKIPSTNKELIYKNIVTRSEFLKWNPWIAKYPTIKLTLVGNEGEIGSGYSWIDEEGDGGKGEMLITGFKPGESVDMVLNFIKPMKATNKTVFKITPDESNCNVSWEMSGSSKFPFNVMHLFMDKMVGPDFEKGLNNLKDKVMNESEILDK